MVSISAYTHSCDMPELFKCNLIQSKPILLLSTDGASDDAPCFPKPLAAAVYFFKNLKLDVLLHGVNTAGLTAFNPVERRMSPLSHDIAGAILPHDAYGSHLDANGKRVDSDLEKENFFKASEILAEIWSNTVIDGHAVDCQAVRLDKEFIPAEVSALWISRHVQQSRYAIQVVKCFDDECCQPFETN